MKQVLFDIATVKERINKGEKLILAGDEKVLLQLPAGSWIAGTIPYFMAEKGGVFSQDKIFVTEIPSYAVDTRISVYDEKNIHNIYAEVPEHGFSVIIISAWSETHKSFALNAHGYKDFAMRPLIGWISGIFLEELGKVVPKVFNGNKTQSFENGAVVFHITLPKNKITDIGIINIFKQGKGDSIAFPEDGFKIKDAYINGKKENFSDYLIKNKIDTRLPLVSNIFGAMINVSFQKINDEDRTVDLYAPVFKGIEYKIAEPVKNYVREFTSMLPQDISDRIYFSCNCILNYLYSELEGKQTADIIGPITFGEVAYQLLNQTLAYMTINDTA
jgi:hypothetical protein